MIQVILRGRKRLLYRAHDAVSAPHNLMTDTAQASVAVSDTHHSVKTV